jgi:uncharacterized RDD family membrane protein YckC
MPSPYGATILAEMGKAAGFWRRFGASLVDGIAVSIVGGILNQALGYHETVGVHAWIAGGQGYGLLVSFVYFTFFHGRSGQTPGDAVAGIRVVDIRGDGTTPIGYGRAAVRWLMSIVSVVVFLLGYLWMIWDGKKQTWHDKAAGSLPVHAGA